MREIIPYEQAEIVETVDAEYRVIDDGSCRNTLTVLLARFALVLFAVVAISAIAWSCGADENTLFGVCMVAIIVTELVVFGRNGGFEKAKNGSHW